VKHYDIVIIGSGIAGSALALVLAKAGLRVLVVEKGQHPHFVIGESWIPSTSYSLEYLAQLFDVPELRAAFRFIGLKEAGCTGWPKRHFWFGWHDPGEPLTPARELCFHALQPPRGPDMHAVRADLDHYLVKQFPKYGAEYQDRTTVTDFESFPDRAELELQDAAGTRKVTAGYVVDCSGHASFLAKKFGLRLEDPGLCTNSRSLFGHFKHVKFLDDVLPTNETIEYLRDGGTVHHLFHGGWIWGIRFDSGIVSVGITMDREVWPLDESITPEQEMWSIINRYPTVKAALGGMEPIRPIIRTGRVHGGTDRIQFSCRSILGDRYILAPHAAAFIDPLFSTGILLTSAFLVRFAAMAVKAKQDGNWSQERFRPLEQLFFTEIEMIDKVVGGMFRSWRYGHDTFVHYWRLWIYIGSVMYLSRVSVAQEDVEGIGVFCTNIPTVMQLTRRMHSILFDPGFEAKEGTRKLKECMDEVWDLKDGPSLMDWPLHVDRTLCVKFLNAGGGKKDMLHLLKWFRRVMAANPTLAEKVDFGRLANWVWETRRRRKAEARRAAEGRNDTFQHAYELIERMRSGVVQRPLTGNPALLWDHQDSAQAKIADIVSAFDVHQLEHDLVTPARPPAAD
jgi:FADH2 O2-dependent halogenase